MEDDIPLREAQVIWDHPSKGEAARVDPPVKVMTLGDKDDPRYDCSWGACNADFNAADDAAQLAMLFHQFHQIVVLYGIDPQAAHTALLVIPEYRGSITQELLPKKYREEA